jgi:DNA-binding response OmpR family regulator
MSLKPAHKLKHAKELTYDTPVLASNLAAVKTKILIVDDDEQIRESLGKVLRTEGYDAALAADGQQATEIFDKERIDLVLLDINLPGHGGWEVFGAFTATDPFLPIIIITGRENQHDLATLAGVGALMEKPLNLPLLLKIIAELIAEESETHLKRLAGLRRDLRYVPSAVQPNILKQRTACEN